MSKRQCIWLIVGVGLILALLLTGAMQENRRPHRKPTAFSVDMTIQQIAPQLGVTGKALARELNLPLDVKKNLACIECGACAKACPLPAIEGRLEKKGFPADCFSCGRCLNICPVDAIKYEALWKA